MSGWARSAAAVCDATVVAVFESTAPQTAFSWMLGMRLLDVGPHLSPQFERTEPGHEDIAGVELVAVILQRRIEDLTGDVVIALRDERHARIADINVLDHDLDAGVDSLLDHILHRFRLAVADDDALHAERDRLLDLLALKRGVLLALEDVQIDAKRFRLPRDARLIGFEIVALREIADERDLDAAFVEWRGRALDPIGISDRPSARRRREGR